MSVGGLLNLVLYKEKGTRLCVEPTTRYMNIQILEDVASFEEIGRFLWYAPLDVDKGAGKWFYKYWNSWLDRKLPEWA